MFCFRSSPRLTGVSFRVDPFEIMSEVIIHLPIMNGEIKKTEIESIFQLLKESNIESATLTRNEGGSSSNGLIGVWRGFITINAGEARPAIDCLYKNNVLSANDRADVENEIRECEKRITEKKLKITAATIAQTDIIRDMFAIPYVEELLDLTTNIDDVLACFKRTLFQYSIWPVYGERLIRSELNDIFSKLAEENQSRLVAAIQTLAKCNQGKASLETVLIKYGQGLPDLFVQKEIILNVLKQKLLQKYSDLNNEKKFLTILKLNFISFEDKIGSSFFDPYADVLNVLLQWVTEKVLNPINFVKCLLRSFQDTNILLSHLSIDCRINLHKAFSYCMNQIELSTSLLEKLTEKELKECRELYLTNEKNLGLLVLNVIKESNPSPKC